MHAYIHNVCVCVCIGSELAALESVDWERIKIRILCIENNEAQPEEAETVASRVRDEKPVWSQWEDDTKVSNVHHLLHSKGYRLAARIAQDDIYVRV